jgi:predicted nucleic acid-binding protein
VADTSAVINLNATGWAPVIVRALPNRLVVVNDVVLSELETGRHRGRQDSDRLNELVATGLMEIVKLSDAATQYFEELVIGPAAVTLDDGEAATIAYAVEQAGTALIDERKATRICADRFPGLCVGCTVDILIHPEVQRHLGAKALGDAVFNAIHDGRMRVFPHHLERVVGLIGHERAALCQSLPRSVRLSPQKSPEHHPGHR